jgi:hypothetical protein
MEAGWCSEILWLMGGNGFFMQKTLRAIGMDLWKYNPATNNWTWGEWVINKQGNRGVYGNKGKSAASR